MNEEEKNAIERCNQLIQVEHANWIGISNQLAIITVLSLIQKQETLINTMQAEFERLENLEDNTDMLKMELKKKDRIIDEMTKVLADYKYEELICMEVDCEHIELQNEGKCIGDKECIKEYFNQKIEKGE